MEEAELDAVLSVVENPVRRRIIKRLSQEPCYALQLSKELGLGQPLVAKHLGVMEEAGVVSSAAERSPTGPSRKRYSLAKSITITMDVAPHLFMERATTFQSRGPEAKGTALARRVDEAMTDPDARSRLGAISRVLEEVDGKLAAVEDERAGLIALRNDLMDEAAKIVASIEGTDRRRVAFHILESHDRQVESISESLDMREMVVRSILEELERDLFG
ncbi:MAG: ArsR family transcriptional regulator [Nitrososphaerota archaeon]|nr:ArsR family transcriptional regulator [Nitrososphaerota archaeon]MDG6966891.1 ArsR family transcriptional regulator [Nitrososphaerota archaeon]MDG6978695.1 ArsR family transcriptional regulator [Nitrososphaerota archaeon]